ncbi:MAG: hypothetical protein AAFY31_00450 [Pseudomonadota bacterium]
MINFTPITMLQLVRANELGIEPAAALLTGMDGAAGYVGFDRLVTAVSDAEDQRDKARKEAKSLTETVDIGTRKFLGLDSGAAVQPAQREEFAAALAATGDDAPTVVVKKGDPAPRLSELSDKIIEQIGEAIGDSILDDNQFLVAIIEFARSFKTVHTKDFDGGENFDDASIDWAIEAAKFLRAVANAHSEASPSEPNVFTWALSRVQSNNEPS